MFGRGQAFFDKKPISEIDFEAISQICTNRDFRRNIRNNYNIWTLNTFQHYVPFDITSSTINTTMK